MRTFTRFVVFAGVLLLATFPALAQPTVPVGAQFRVNTFTTGVQYSAKVAMAPDGGIVVVWEDSSQANGDTAYFSIEARRYASDGSAAGSELLVNSYTTGDQGQPGIAMDSDGNFVVVWLSSESAYDDSSGSIHARRFASDGSAFGPQFQVNSYTTSLQHYPAVAMAADGDFVVAWCSLGSYGNDDDSDSLQGQRYSSDGTALGSQFQINSYTTGSVSRPSVAMAANGDFVVVWYCLACSYEGDMDASVQGQRYASDGSARGSQFQVNSYTTNGQLRSSVAMAENGDFIIAWESSGSYGSDDDSTSVQGQRYTSDGSALGSQFQINSYTTEKQLAPSVAVATTGEFVVAWHSYGSDEGDIWYYSVQAQLFDSSGSARGSQFQVNSYTTRYQIWPAVSVSPTGNFVVVWESDGGENGDFSSFSVQAQRFKIIGIFADGFEAGNTTAWSSSVGGS